MEEKINELLKNALIVVSDWNGFRVPYIGKKVITKDKKMYTYQKYLRQVPEELKEYFDGNESFYETKISDEDYEKVENFIRDKILHRKIEIVFSRDASHSISGNLGKNFCIQNDYELYGEINKLFREFYKKNLSN